MGFIFTEHLRLLAAGKEPTEEELEAVLNELGKVLKRKMRERSLWSAPPSFLGVSGRSWLEKGVFEELLHDCYCFSFADRLSPLVGLLQLQDDIDGVVLFNTGNFLSERQRMNDPVGYRTFQVLQIAVRESMGAEELWVLEGDARIRNATVLGFSSTASHRPEPLEAAVVEMIEAWSDELLPGLVTARGREKALVVGRLRRRLVALKDHGIESFRFKDVIDPLKREVRRRWRAVSSSSQGEMGFEDGEDEGGLRVQIVSPDSCFEDREALDQLDACVEDEIDRLAAREKTRADLRKLWIFLKAQAAEEGPAGKRPSWRKIGEELEIPRSSLPKLFSTLGDLVENCRMGEGEL